MSEKRICRGAAALGAMVFSMVLAAQNSGEAVTTQQARRMMSRCLELMDAAGVALPELARAGTPLIENARQALGNIRSLGENLQFYNIFQGNVQAYLSVAEALPKPATFPELARKQLGELRDQYGRVEGYFGLLLVQRDAQLQSPDRDNLERYAEANSHVNPPKSGNPRVVFLGDSITDFWRLNEYYGDRDFINRGISGQTTGQMLGRMLSDVVNLHPRAVLVLGGTNDLGRGMPLATIENNLTMIADLADYYKIKVIIASVPPVSDYHKDADPSYERTKLRQPASIRSLNGWLANLCSNRGYTFVDYYSALADGSGMMNTEFSDDGLHPNSKGYRLMAPLALEAVNKNAGEEVVAPQPPPKKHRLFSK